jgi:hypothetical protein
MFPIGRVGFALAALRIGVGALSLTDVSPFENLLATGGYFANLLSSTFILSGALTPYLCAIRCIVEVTKIGSLKGLGTLHLAAVILIVLP